MNADLCWFADGPVAGSMAVYSASRQRPWDAEDLATGVVTIAVHLLPSERAGAVNVAGPDRARVVATWRRIAREVAAAGWFTPPPLPAPRDPGQATLFESDEVRADPILVTSLGAA
jgi:hypothetical protein